MEGHPVGGGPVRRMRYLLLIGRVALGVAVLSAGAFAAEPGPPRLGSLAAPESARVVVEKLPCNCGGESGSEPDLLLVTVGTESWVDGERHFHPILTLAFDPLLAEAEPGQWLALWNFGPSPAGAWRTFRSVFPIPARRPKASPEQLQKLETRIEQVRAGQRRASAPKPYADLSRFRPATAKHGTTMGLKRVVNWLGLINPGQLLLRTFLLHRGDRAERNFQRAYLGLSWLLDIEFDGTPTEQAWLRDMNELRFHLLRNLSFFGRWVAHSEALDIVYGHDSRIRETLSKGSAWLQADANEYHLRYEPLQRFTANGTPVPVGGILYYDPRIAPAPDRVRWPKPNVFDLAYNPFTHPAIQRLARAHPDQPIPLALYVFQSDLGLRPIIVADFFAPGNPQARERNHQGMVWLREWLIVSTSWLSPERLGYRVAAYAANKKAFTPLVSKSARLGVEELRLAVESNLYLDPTLRAELLQLVDRRVQNPLIKPAPVEARLAHLQYEALIADQGRVACQQVEEIRERLQKRYKIESSLPAEERQRRLQAALAEARARRHLRDLTEMGFHDLATQTALDSPLRYFEENAATQEASAAALRELYADLYRETLELRVGTRLAQISQTAERAAEAWARVETARGMNSADFDTERRRVESRVRDLRVKEEQERQKRQVKLLRAFLEDAHKQLERAGCGQADASPADIEMYLVMLMELPEALQRDPALLAEFRKHQRTLERDLTQLRAVLEQCPDAAPDPWRREQRQANLLLVRAAGEKLFPTTTIVAGNGEK